MAHHYAIRTFDETAPVVRGGATAAYELAGTTLEPRWSGRLAADPADRTACWKTEIDAVTVSFAALLQEVSTRRCLPRPSMLGPSLAGRDGFRARRRPRHQRVEEELLHALRIRRGASAWPAHVSSE